MAEVPHRLADPLCAVCIAERRRLIQKAPHVCGLVLVPDERSLTNVAEGECVHALSIAAHLLGIRPGKIPQLSTHAAARTTMAVGRGHGELPPEAVAALARKRGSKPPKSRR